MNTSDSSGGAEKVSLELHEQYLAMGLQATLAVGWKQADSPGVVQIPNAEARSLWARVVGRSRRPGAAGALLRGAGEPGRYLKRLRGHEDFCFPASALIAELSPTPPDVIHLHNLHGGYFDIRALPGLSRAFPTVYSPHDPWALTGHCAHPMDCERWLSGCGHCPDLGRFVPIHSDASDWNWRTKRAAFEASSLYLLTASHWLMGLFEQSGLTEHVLGARVIPNGVDPQVFKPGSQKQARERIGLAEEGILIATSARAATASDFKGYEVLHEALLKAGDVRGHNHEQITVLMLGEQGPPRDVGAFRIHPVAHDPAAEHVANVLRAADIYVHPSRAENYSLAIIEALACGTPVFASDVGGTPEIAKDHSALRLFRSGDAKQLAQILRPVCTDGLVLRELQEKARAEAGHCYTLMQQAAAYVDCYEEAYELHTQREILRTPE